VCAYTGNELRGHLFSSLWPEDQRSKIDAILKYLCKNATGAVCNIVGKELRGRSADFELMLLPLATATGLLERILGVLSPFSPPYWVGQWRIIIWQLNSARIVRPDRNPPSMKMKDLLDTSHSLDPAHTFTIIDGGLAARESSYSPLKLECSFMPNNRIRQ